MSDFIWNNGDVIALGRKNVEGIYRHAAKEDKCKYFTILLNMVGFAWFLLKCL